MKRLLLVIVLLLAAPAATGQPAAPATDAPAPAPEPAATPAADPAPASSPAQADDTVPSLDELLKDKASDAAQQWSGPEPRRVPDYPWIEHHGYLRVRCEGFYRASLGTEHTRADQQTVVTSGFLPPLTENGANKSSPISSQVGPRGEDWLASANMRFRYAPTLHVAEPLSIRAEFDVLDNLMFGSTPDWNPARPDAPLALFSRSQAVPSARVNGLKDSVRVKQAYLVWDLLNPTSPRAPAVQISAGRMARHWGLGMLLNDGEDLDADWGTYEDRIAILARAASIYFELGYTWVASGPTSESASRTFGETHDLTDTDDVTELSLAIFSKPLTEAERRARFDKMAVRNRPVFDWGVFASWRRQDLDLSQDSYARLQSGQIDPSTAGGGYDQLALVKRGAWTVTPDVWARFQWSPDARRKLRLELEGAAVIGHVDRVIEGDAASSMDIRSFGAAFQSEYSQRIGTGVISTGLDLGFATGDTAEYFGFLDHTNFADPKVHNPRLASFWFNPDYRVDQLLFRQVIGTVTNAVYFKPWVQYDFFESEKDALAGRLDILYGRALEPSATPGNSPQLGVETNLKVFYEDKGLFYAGIEWAMLWPLAGLDLIPSFQDAGVSYTSRWSTAVRGRVGVQF